ncbi:MAG: Trm112 family protein [Planctomycetes bacterium]|nr:Trm112 family protein [Planctomycetota bacterium]
MAQAIEKIRKLFSLDILRCPADDRGELELRTEDVRCRSCGRIYPIVGGFPVLIVSESRFEPEPGNNL